jgi:plastocyanin domain-containing protein
MQNVKITVTDQGFEPKTVNVQAEIPVVLNITRESDLTCAKEIVIPEKKISKKLPLHKTVKIALGKLAKGEIRFGCGMNMMEAGQIHVQ